MDYYNHLLVNHWLSNVIDNKINKKSDFKKDFNLDTSNYKVFDIDEINSLYEI